MFLNVSQPKRTIHFSVVADADKDCLGSFNLRGGKKAIATKTDSPYLYVIQHKKTKALYVGARWTSGADPTKFGSSYKTSSPYVKELGFENFDVLCIVARPDARQFEAKLLRQLFDLLGYAKFVKHMINRHICTGAVLSEKARKAISDAN